MSIDAPTQPLHKRPALTRSQVKRLRESYADNVGFKALRKRFGISQERLRKYLNLKPIDRKEKTECTEGGKRPEGNGKGRPRRGGALNLKMPRHRENIPANGESET